MVGSWASTKVDGQHMRLYLSLPSGSGPFPGVVVIHHGAGVGLDQFTQDITDRFAEEGYASIAPDMFHRVTDAMLADGRARYDHLDDVEIVADVDATIDFLRDHPAVDSARVGVTGFCMGGRIAYLAASNPDFSGAVPYYGSNIMIPRGSATRSPFDLNAEIDCPIMFHFGETDPNPSQEDMATLDAELSRLGKPHQFFTYSGAGHGFMNHTGDGYHREAAETAWARTLDFFALHLKRTRVS